MTPRYTYDVHARVRFPDGATTDLPAITVHAAADRSDAVRIATQRIQRVWPSAAVFADAYRQ